MDIKKKLTAVELKQKAMEASRQAYQKAKKNGTLKPVLIKTY